MKYIRTNIFTDIEFKRITKTIMGNTKLEDKIIFKTKSHWDKTIKYYSIRRPTVASVRKLIESFNKRKFVPQNVGPTHIVLERKIPSQLKLELITSIILASNYGGGKGHNTHPYYSEFYVGTRNIDLKYIGFNKQYTLDELFSIFNNKVSKTIIGTVLGNLDINHSSKKLIMECVLNGKIEPYRVLGGATIVQFSKKELMEIINNGNFIAKRSVPMCGDRTDITNRYRLVMHQDVIDEDIIFEIMSTITDKYAKLRFAYTTKTKKFLKRVKGKTELELWLKLQ